MSLVKLQYFKPSGKWGYEGEMFWDDDKSMHGLMDEIENLNLLRKLSGLASGRWEGFIYVDTTEHPMGYPLLIVNNQHGRL